MAENKLPTFGEEIEKEIIIEGKKILKQLLCIEICEYDENENLIHLKNNTGTEKWYDYDDAGNCIYRKDNKDFELWYEYDENGNLICEKDKKNYKCSYEYEYDKNGNVIYWKNSAGAECWKVYDKSGKLIEQVNEEDGTASWQRIENNSGKECVSYELENEGILTNYDYDKNGNLLECSSFIPYRQTNLGGTFYEYDEKGNLIYKKYTEDEYVVIEEFFEYEYYSSGRKKIAITYEILNEEDEDDDEY